MSVLLFFGDLVQQVIQAWHQATQSQAAVYWVIGDHTIDAWGLRKKTTKQEAWEIHTRPPGLFDLSCHLGIIFDSKPPSKKRIKSVCKLTKRHHTRARDNSFIRAVCWCQGLIFPCQMTNAGWASWATNSQFSKTEERVCRLIAPAPEPGPVAPRPQGGLPPGEVSHPPAPVTGAWVGPR